MRQNHRSPENRKAAANHHRAVNARLRRMRRGDVAIKEINEGDVVWARQEFTDCDESKIRPMVVVEVAEDQLTVRRVTTKNRHNRHTETPTVRLGRQSWVNGHTEVIDRQRVIDLVG